MKVTKKDIADYLGISRTAVSLVLNGSSKCTISKKTQQEILEAAEKLGYKEKNPCSVTKKICCAFFFNFGNSVEKIFNSVYISEVDSFLERYNYNTVYFSVTDKESSINRFFRYIESGEADGVILINLVDEKITKRVSQFGIPYVIFSEIGDAISNVVCPDSYHVAKEMARSLINNNHKKIAFFATAMNFPQQKNFLKGYKDALAEADIPFDPVLVQTSIIQDGREIAERMQLLGIEYTAALCANTHIQSGALRWFIENEIKVPEKMSLLGYGMNDLVSLSVPRMTVCDVVQHEYIYEGLNLLMDGIKKGQLSFTCRKIKTLDFYPGQTVARFDENA